MWENIAYKDNKGELQINCQSSCTSYNPTSNGEVSILLSPHPQQHVLSSEIFILAILTGEKWNFRVILACSSLITKDLNI